MQKLTLFFLGLVIVVRLSATTAPLSLSTTSNEPQPNANTILLPLGNTGKTISLMQLSVVTVHEFEMTSGKKLSFFGKLAFRHGQKKLRKKINKDGTVNGKFLQSFAGRLADDDSKGLDMGSFFLGFFLLWIGVLLAYVTDGNNKKKRVKSAWIGFGAAGFLILLFGVMFSGFS